MANVRTSFLGLDDPFDVYALGTDTGTNAWGWRTGAAQEITGLTPGTLCELSVEGQIILGLGPEGDDCTLTLYWVDEPGLTNWQTPRPGVVQSTGMVPPGAVQIGQITGQTGNWTTLSGYVSPGGTACSIGYEAVFSHPSWDYGACNHAVDEWMFRPMEAPRPVSGVSHWEIVE
jgi:hypothetical protein